MTPTALTMSILPISTSALPFWICELVSGVTLHPFSQARTSYFSFTLITMFILNHHKSLSSASFLRSSLFSATSPTLSRFSLALTRPCPSLPDLLSWWRHVVFIKPQQIGLITAQPRTLAYASSSKHFSWIGQLVFSRLLLQQIPSNLFTCALAFWNFCQFSRHNLLLQLLGSRVQWGSGARPRLSLLSVLSSDPGTEEALETSFWNEIRPAMSTVCCSSRSKHLLFIFQKELHSCVFFFSLLSHFD